MITSLGVNNIVVKDLVLDGNMYDGDCDDIAIVGVKNALGENISVLNLNVTRIRKHGYGPTLSNYTYLFNSWLGNNGWNGANPNRNHNATLMGNFITGWRDVGISTWSSINVYILSNVVVEPVYDEMGFNTANWGVGVEPGSLWQWDSYNVIINNNWIAECNASAGVKGTGVAIGTMHGKRPWNIVIDNNTIRYTKWGIRQWSTRDLTVLHSRITIQNNNIKDCVDGIWLTDSDNNTILGNNISNSRHNGIILDRSNSNEISRNNVKNSGRTGVQLSESCNNKFFNNNFINNSAQSQAADQTRLCNTWDDGYPNGGNYWSDYLGPDFSTGPRQNREGSDGIGDTPYTIAANVDRYPLMNPIGLPQPPIAAFTFSPEQPVEGRRTVLNASVSHDRDGFIKIYEWDFDDDNISAVSAPTITHIYSEPGTYTVKLTVTDSDKMSHSTTATVEVMEDSAPPTTFPDYDGLWTNSYFTGLVIMSWVAASIAVTRILLSRRHERTVSTHACRRSSCIFANQTTSV